MAGQGTGRDATFAFTLVELLVVLAVVALLGGLIAPITTAARQKARQIQCASNLGQLNCALVALTTDTSGFLPPVYYSLADNHGTYDATLKNSADGRPDRLFDYVGPNLLLCPTDDRPVSVLARTSAGDAGVVPSSYAYNVMLPLRFRNNSRVWEFASVVSFYDGDVEGVLGTRNLTDEWAEPTVRLRHRGSANYAFLDGHVENRADFPATAFTSGANWITISVATIGGHTITGEIGINQNPPDFLIHWADGSVWNMDDLKGATQDYEGTAVLWQMKPKGGAIAVLSVDGKPYPLERSKTYTITAASMTVRVYNDQRNAKGKAVGHWYARIILAENATITAH